MWMTISNKIEKIKKSKIVGIAQATKDDVELEFDIYFWNIAVIIFGQCQ